MPADRSMRRAGFLFAAAVTILFGTFTATTTAAQPAIIRNAADVLQPVLGQVQNVLTAISLFEVASGKRGKAIEHLMEIRRRTGELVATNANILEGMKQLRIAMRQDIERAFQEDTFKELAAEYADFRILVADENPSFASAYLADKAYRLDQLADKVASYDAAGFSAYCAVIALQFAVHAMAETDRKLLISKAQRHRDSIDRWLDGTREGTPVSLNNGLSRKIEILEFLTQPQLLKIGEIALNKGAAVRIDDIVIEVEKGRSGVSLLQYRRPISLHISGNVPAQYQVAEGNARYFRYLTPENIQSYFPCMKGDKNQFVDIPEAALSQIMKDAESKRSCLVSFIHDNAKTLPEDRNARDNQQNFIALMVRLRAELDDFSIGIHTPVQLPPPMLRK